MSQGDHARTALTQQIRAVYARSKYSNDKASKMHECDAQSDVPPAPKADPVPVFPPPKMLVPVFAWPKGVVVLAAPPKPGDAGVELETLLRVAAVAHRSTPQADCDAQLYSQNHSKETVCLPVFVFAEPKPPPLPKVLWLLLEPKPPKPPLPPKDILE
jgi:hypothetical protein